MKTEKQKKTVNLKTDGHKTTTKNQIFTMNQTELLLVLSKMQIPHPTSVVEWVCL